VIYGHLITDEGLEDERSYSCVAQNQFVTVSSTAYVAITGIGKYTTGQY